MMIRRSQQGEPLPTFALRFETSLPYFATVIEIEALPAE
jgi:hypothetical protein